MTGAVAMRRACASDIAFVMSTERLDGYDALVGSWSEAQHRATLEDPRCAVFIARLRNEDIGFAILNGWDSDERRTLIRRVAITRPGSGIGTAFVRLLVDTAFETTGVHRLTIGTFPENLRARRCYERAGFTAEGVARDGAFFAGRYRDELILSILRPEWEQRRP